MTKIGQQIESYDVSVEQTKPADVRKGVFFLFFFFILIPAGIVSTARHKSHREREKKEN